ncbi:dihydroneopterin aldolase [Muriicola jejuensis]|uniref:7,8-dihydroneopterin aldolase n=1 Tax=Muriicola jejuensis TaxID=504488 RepID=A0A6P0UBR6_9FLAO|nr:dihydroneopterin aldolase [Muriicola jejuensis]NER09940.1 dihydroneopterin aldolase [Muriicola jejuensis]SMP04541.1 dihydroneopterin aldolase [Muriicola jejuensis]
MDTITLENIRLYAYHGCLEEETLIGSDYRVDVEVEARLEKAAISDELGDTADYVTMHRIVKEEMKIPSKLLEHVARRIALRILEEIPMVQGGNVKVAKINPPIGGDVASVSMKYRFSR